jgi:WD40 repeat protein
LQQSTDGYILRFTPDSQFLLVDDNQARLHLMNLETHKDDHIFAGHHGLVWDTSFTPDSRRLATVGQDHTIRVWDTQAGREILRFDEKSLPTAVAFSPDGLRLVTVSSNHVHFWDAALFATTPDKPNWLFYGVRGNYLSGIEDWPEAIKDYTQSLALGGDAGYLRLKRGYANAALGNSAAAEDDLKSALSVDPTNPSTIEDLYSLLLGEGRLPECRTITAQYEDLASKQSNNQTTNTAGWLFSLTPTDDTHAEELVKSMRSAVEHSPDDYDLRSTLGSVLYRSGKYQDAISTLRKGMDLKKLNANETAEGASIDHDQDGTALDWVFLSMSYCKLHDIPNAKKWLKQVSDKIERINHDPMYEDPNWNWQWDQSTQLKVLYDEATTLVEHSSL